MWGFRKAHKIGGIATGEHQESWDQVNRHGDAVLIFVIGIGLDVQMLRDIRRRSIGGFAHLLRALRHFGVEGVLKGEVFGACFHKEHSPRFCNTKHWNSIP